MSTPESQTLHADDKTDYKALLEQFAAENAERKWAEEEEQERKEQEKAVREVRIAELRQKKAEQEAQWKKAEEERLAKEENKRKEKEQQEQKEKEKREQRRREEQEAERRRKQARGGEDEDGDVAMGEPEDRGWMKWMKSGELEKSKVGPSRPKGKGRVVVPSRS